MSRYIQIFMRVGKDRFVELTNDPISAFPTESIGLKIPEGSLSALSLEEVRRALTNLKTYELSLSSKIESFESLIKKLGNWNNTMDEKIGYLEEYNDHIEDCREEIESVKVLTFLFGFCENFYLIRKYSGDDEYYSNIGLYIGIDVGYEVEVNDNYMES